MWVDQVWLKHWNRKRRWKLKAERTFILPPWPSRSPFRRFLVFVNNVRNQARKQLRLIQMSGWNIKKRFYQLETFSQPNLFLWIIISRLLDERHLSVSRIDQSETRAAFKPISKNSNPDWFLLFYALVRHEYFKYQTIFKTIMILRLKISSNHFGLKSLNVVNELN